MPLHDQDSEGELREVWGTEKGVRMNQERVDDDDIEYIECDLTPKPRKAPINQKYVIINGVRFVRESEIPGLVRVSGEVCAKLIGYLFRHEIECKFFDVEENNFEHCSCEAKRKIEAISTILAADPNVIELKDQL